MRHQTPQNSSPLSLDWFLLFAVVTAAVILQKGPHLWLVVDGMCQMDHCQEVPSLRILCSVDGECASPRSCTSALYWADWCSSHVHAFCCHLRLSLLNHPDRLLVCSGFQNLSQFRLNHQSLTFQRRGLWVMPFHESELALWTTQLKHFVDDHDGVHASLLFY